MIWFTIWILPYYFNCIVKRDSSKNKNSLLLVQTSTNEAQTDETIGLNLEHAGDWVTTEWSLNIILISKKPKQHKRQFLQHKREHKRLRLFWQRFALGGGPTSWDCTGLAKSLARRPGAIVFSSRATKMYHCPARRATLNTEQGVFKALKSFKYVKWYKKSLNCNFKRSYSWGWKGKNHDKAGLNFKRQLCHWINMSAAHFKVKTLHGCLYVNASLKGTVCPQKRVVGIFI